MNRPFKDEIKIQSKVDANNAAYTSKTLGLHVDLPYYENMPGVSLSLAVSTVNHFFYDIPYSYQWPLNLAMKDIQSFKSSNRAPGNLPLQNERPKISKSVGLRVGRCSPTLESSY